MTDLRRYIDRVLGNKLRCLLPSYWWKQLFHSVVDRIDEAEKNASDLVAKSMLEFEAKHPDVASRTLFYTEDPESEEAKKNASLLMLELISISVNLDSKGEYTLKPFYFATKPYMDELWQIQPVESVYTVYPGLCFPSVHLNASVADTYSVIFSMSDGTATATKNQVGSSVTVDNALSTTSKNPVQNKVVTSALNAKADKTYVDEQIGSINAILDTINEEVI